ncbi:MAG: hypothetical protein U0Q16_24065 [Bryobacteraceae bacterium]
MQIRFFERGGLGLEGGALGLKTAEFGECAMILAGKARFLALDVAECLGIVGKVLVREGGAARRIDRFESLADSGFGAGQFEVVSGRLDGPGAADAPLGGGHLFDELGFDGVGGLEAIHVGDEELAPGGGVLCGEDDGAGSGDGFGLGAGCCGALCG